MCVILVKERGIELPTKDILESCWKRNPDGAGFMFNDCDKVVIMKGFMTFEEFYLRKLIGYHQLIFQSLIEKLNFYKIFYPKN